MKTVLKLLLAVCIIAVGSPAFADPFTNGGFELGNLSGWTIDYGNRNSGSETVNWAGAYNSGGNPAGLIGSNGKVTATPVRTDSGNNPLGQTNPILPYNDNYMAIINDANYNSHATRITQTSAALTAQDFIDSTKLYVNWGAALVEPSNSGDHSPSDFPFFEINVFQNAVLKDTFHINSNQAAQAGSGFVQIGTEPDASPSKIWYKNGQFVYDLVGGGFVAGDTIKVDMFVADCGLGGHGAYAFLDGIGTTEVEPPPNGVPEPATMLLLGFGLVGVAGLRRRFRK